MPPLVFIATSGPALAGIIVKIIAGSKQKSRPLEKDMDFFFCELSYCIGCMFS
jgi:hypothetical protein